MRDAEGLRLVLAEMLERDLDLFRIKPQLDGKSGEQQQRLRSSVAKVTLSPGYERWATHLILLEDMQQAGVRLGELQAAEVAGLRILRTARLVHKGKHPPCPYCGMPQHNRFQSECADCGGKLKRSKR